MKYRTKEHFSHQHVLHALQQEEGDKIAQCEGCEEQILNLSSIHGCLSCDFYLHDSCANAPRFLDHPSHPLHSLTLLPMPTHSSGAYNCNACGAYGKAFGYSCARCEFDLHIKCASMPTTVVQEHSHKLELIFDSSYQKDGCVFRCDVCTKIVKFGPWLYYCKKCDIGIHPGCVKWNGFLEKDLWDEGENSSKVHEKIKSSSEINQGKDVPSASKGGVRKVSFDIKNDKYAKSKV